MDATGIPDETLIPQGMSQAIEKASQSNDLRVVTGTFPLQALSQHRVYGKFLDSLQDSPVWGYYNFYSPFGMNISLIEQQGKITLDILNLGEVGTFDDLRNPYIPPSGPFYLFQDFNDETAIDFALNRSRSDVVIQDSAFYG